MKELSIEEKAKAYDKAIKVAADIKAGTATYITDGTPVVDAIFPEFKESEDALTWLTKYIEEEAYSLSMDIRDNEDRIRLKNLKDRFTWKPSEEQIKAVKEAACYSSVFSEKTIDNLILLSKQLKKLREE